MTLMKPLNCSTPCSRYQRYIYQVFIPGNGPEKGTTTICYQQFKNLFGLSEGRMARLRKKKFAARMSNMSNINWGWGLPPDAAKAAGIYAPSLKEKI
jgi:hypothetical protein